MTQIKLSPINPVRTNDAKLVKSSGNKEFDKAVLNAVERTGSLPQLNGLEKKEAKKFSRISLNISR